MKRTKIICTMGPNTDDEEMMRKLAKAGMDIARFNFSHGDHEEQKTRMDLLKKVRKELKLPIAILLDTKGPEIRTGILEGGQKVYLEEGSQFTLTTEQIEGNNTRCSQTYKDLPKDVKAGDTVLIDDGLIQLTVEEVTDTDVVCRVVNGGELGQKKGINVPNVEVKLPAITEQDKNDILFGIEQGIDFIAASFVRNAEAIKEIKELLRANGGERIDVIAKIENAEGVHNIDKIIKAADGVMVARGDLGVEIPAHEVPHIQKMIIRKCNESYKPVITATQMLDSMMRAPRPTRAEVTDVANAIYDGTDAIMLSGETAMGKYPEQAVQMMVKIAECTEPYMTHKRFLDYRALRGNKNVSSAVGVAAVQTTENLGADCIVTPTISGQTARLISNFRPKVPIYAVSPNEWARRKMQIYWGVTSVAGYEEDSTENIISHAMYIVRRENLVKKGDIVVFTAGDPATNMVNGEGAVTNIMQVIQAK
ncbi:pyruvate kinase [Blautia faecicola]|uniref:Pyruvate kinase n=1 Tax=Blautia faecicola TaxID=2509240 RepID=A0A4Q1RIL1_9FIRM|nr:pyruvate kinase [Blautia faecicola]RXS75571.1 pyruvate kinase [Blautia faecicola]